MFRYNFIEYRTEDAEEGERIRVREKDTSRKQKP